MLVKNSLVLPLNLRIPEVGYAILIKIIISDWITDLTNYWILNKVIYIGMLNYYKILILEIFYKNLNQLTVNLEIKQNNWIICSIFIFK